MLSSSVIELFVVLATWCKQPTDSLEKTLMLGKTEGRRRRGWQRMRRLDGVTDTTDMSLSKFQEIVKGRAAWRAVVHGVAKSWARLSDELKHRWPKTEIKSCSFRVWLPRNERLDGGRPWYSGFWWNITIHTSIFSKKSNWYSWS